MDEEPDVCELWEDEEEDKEEEAEEEEEEEEELDGPTVVDCDVVDDCEDVVVDWLPPCVRRYAPAAAATMSTSTMTTAPERASAVLARGEFRPLKSKRTADNALLI